jgi:hypothetical protein
MLNEVQSASPYFYDDIEFNNYINLFKNFQWSAILTDHSGVPIEATKNKKIVFDPEVHKTSRNFTEDIIARFPKRRQDNQFAYSTNGFYCFKLRIKKNDPINGNREKRLKGILLQYFLMKKYLKLHDLSPKNLFNAALVLNLRCEGPLGEKSPLSDDTLLNICKSIYEKAGNLKLKAETRRSIWTKDWLSEFTHKQRKSLGIQVIKQIRLLEAEFRPNVINGLIDQYIKDNGQVTSQKHLAEYIAPLLKVSVKRAENLLSEKTAKNPVTLNVNTNDGINGGFYKKDIQTRIGEYISQLMQEGKGISQKEIIQNGFSARSVERHYPKLKKEMNINLHNSLLKEKDKSSSSSVDTNQVSNEDYIDFDSIDNYEYKGKY